MEALHATHLVGLKIALCGAALMLMGIAIAGQIQHESAANAASNALGIVPLVPSVAGALLTFFGAIRISMAARPLYLVAFGFILVIAASAIPFVATRLLPEMKTYRWTLPSLLPLFTLRIVGLIFLATALLRLLVGTKNRS